MKKIELTQVEERLAYPKSIKYSSICFVGIKGLVFDYNGKGFSPAGARVRSVLRLYRACEGNLILGAILKRL